jgi:hypothetical protein
MGKGFKGRNGVACLILLIAAWYLSLLAYVGAAAAGGFAWIVWRAGPRKPSNLALAGLLVLESLVQLSLGIITAAWPGGKLDVMATTEPNRWTFYGDLLRMASLALLSGSYFLFLGRLPSRSARWLRGPVVGGAIFVLLAANGAHDFVSALQAYAKGGATYDYSEQYPLYAVAGLVALVLMALWIRETPPSSSDRARAKAFTWAFGLRDAANIVGFLSWLAGILLPPWYDPLFVYVPVTVLGTIGFVVLLARAFLRTQLFDIDLRIKAGLARTAVAAFFLLVFLVVSQLVQNVTSASYGAVAGAVVAALLLFALRPIEAAAGRLASATMPNVVPTPAYIHFRKMDVYRAAAVEVLADGTVSPKERRTLDSLRVQLGIALEDAKAIEADASLASEARPPTPSA